MRRKAAGVLILIVLVLLILVYLETLGVKSLSYVMGG